MFHIRGRELDRVSSLKNETQMSTESRMTALEVMVSQIAMAVGVSTPKVTPKTSARMGQKPVIAAMAVKTKGSNRRMDDIVLENVGGNRQDGRMRLPSRMFGTRDSITVDGHKFTSLPSDQNRSANFNPAILEAEVGDTVTFSHEGGSKWTCSIASGSRKKKAAPKTTTKPATKVTAKPAVVGKGTKAPNSKLSLAKEAAKTFGIKARENAAEDFQNENILEYTKFEDDPRQYLTSRENAQAKRVWKGKAGITLSAWVELLSKEVYG